MSIANTGSDIELTSDDAEIALAPQVAHAAHQAFSKTSCRPNISAGAILATRRRRSPGEAELWVAHLAVVEGEAVGEVEVETDRARRPGAATTSARRLRAIDGRRLSNTVGPVLDPVFALRRRLWIPAGSTARIAFWTLAAGSREALLDAIDRHRAPTPSSAPPRSPGQAQVQLRHLDIAPSQASLYQRLAGHMLYCQSRAALSLGVPLRPRAAAGLWAQGISGDVPMIRIDEVEDLGIVASFCGAREELAAEGPGGRSRDPERARRLLCPGPAPDAGHGAVHPPHADTGRRGEREGPHLRPAQRPDSWRPVAGAGGRLRASS